MELGPAGTSSSGGARPGIVGQPGAAVAPSHRRRRRGIRVFSSVADAPRARRATDVMILAVAAVGLVVLWWPAPGPTAIDTDLTTFLQHLTGIWDALWQVGYATMAIWPIALVLLVLANRGRRRLLGDWAVAIGLAGVLSFVIGDLAGTPFSTSLRSLASTGPPPVYLAVRLALATAVVATASPHLSRPLRRIGRGVLLLGAISAVAIDVAYTVGAVAGFFVGLAAAAGAHLLLGSPGGQLSPGEVTDALSELGLPVTDVRHAPVQTPGVVLMTAVAADGSPLLVKVYGRDAWDSQFLASLWTAAVRRGERPHLGRSRRGQLEHEAVATLVAQRAGVPVLPEVLVGSTGDGDAILVTRLDGRRFAVLDADEITDEHLQNAWRALVSLHAAGITHGRIDGHHVLAAEGGRVLLADLAEAALVASPDAIATDRARLLVTTANRTADGRAVAAALAVLGAEDLAAVLPYLQPAVLDRATRKAVPGGKNDVKQLRAAAAEAAGVQPPPLAGRRSPAEHR